MWLFKINRQGKSAVSGRSSIHQLSFFSPSFFTPSWCNNCNFGGSNSWSPNNLFRASVLVWLPLFSLSKQSVTHQMELLLVSVTPILAPAFYNFRFLSVNFAINRVTWAIQGLRFFVLSAASFLFCSLVTILYSSLQLL